MYISIDNKFVKTLVSKFLVIIENDKTLHRPILELPENILR